jgi:predicted transposase/invertase (TIGR01784 family)
MTRLIRFEWAIKKLLRHKANFTILEGFLTELLGVDVQIQDILESERNKASETDKYNRVDILVKTANGELMLVEVQQDSETDYFHRMLYGISKLITEHINEGDPYGTIRKVISINIVYFGLGQGNDYIYEYRGEFVGKHQRDVLLPTQRQQKDFQIQHVAEIFPRYFILNVNNFDNVAKNTLDEWMYFLKNSEVPDNFQAKGLQEAREKLRVESLPEAERKSYERFRENRRIERSVWETALSNAVIEKTTSFVQTMIERGYDDSEIATITQMPLDWITVIREGGTIL